MNSILPLKPVKPVNISSEQTFSFDQIKPLVDHGQAFWRKKVQEAHPNGLN